MRHDNDNCKSAEKRIEIDCWLDGDAPYLVTMFDPSTQPEPIISELFEELSSARIVAESYAAIHGPIRVYDMTGEAA